MTSPTELAVVVLAAGQGTRMKSRTPKVLHPVGGRPLVGHVLDTAASLDPARIVVVVRHERELVAETVSELAPGVVVVDQDEVPGTGRAVEVALDALVGAPRFVARGEIYEQLGGTLLEHPVGGSYVPTGERGATDVPGVWVIGNSTDLAAVVVAAMAAGVGAGGAVHMDLITEDVRRAVAARRAA